MIKQINLSFDPETANAFNAYYIERYADYTRKVLLVITTFFSLSGFLDYLLASPKLSEAFTLRYAFVLPLLFAINLAVFYKPLIRFIQPFIIIYILAICAFLFSMGTKMNQAQNIFYLSGLIVTQLVAVCMLRIRFKDAVFATCCILACGQFMLWSTHAQTKFFLIFNYFALSISILGLVSNYFLELSARLEYIHRQRFADEVQVLEDKNASLNLMAHTDELTNLANRRTFDETLPKEWRRGRRNGTTLSIALIDIDYFKKYNDHYGHPAGDACLRKVAKTLKQCSQRAGDLVARYGGEEFIFLLPNTSLKDATQVAEKIRSALGEASISHPMSPISDHLTISCGICSIDLTDPSASFTPSDLIKSADINLYKAKSAGRDQVVESQL